MDFSQLALLFVVAAFFGIISTLLRQPLFTGYLIAGIFLSLTGRISDVGALTSFGHIGVALLLFLLGLEMSLRDISSVGKPALILATGQVLITFVLGYLTSLALGFNGVASFYIAVALTFSSTIIAVRLLSEKDDLASLYGRLSVALLLIQDFIAVIILMFLTGLGSGEASGMGYLSSFLKGGLLIVGVWVLSKKLLPELFERITLRSPELLFIVSISWALGISAFVSKFAGFNLEIGGFLAGLALSGLPEHLQIANKAKPLRDFFLTIFFLILGTQLTFRGNVGNIFIISLVLSLFVILTHIFVVMAIMGVLGFKKRTSFLVGVSGAQISEFSLIIASMGVAIGHLTKQESGVITLVGVITMIISTYLIIGEDKIFEFMKKYLDVFEKERTKEHAFLPDEKMDSHIVLVGCDRTGRQIIKYFKKKKIPFLVVDFNPKVFTDLTAQGVPVIFGDINDTEILDVANISKSRLVILTTSNLSDNLNFLEYLKNLSQRPKTIFTSSSKNDAIDLYEKGADYVIVPEMVAGEHIKHLLKIYGMRGDRLSKVGQSHFKRLMFI